jgi:hypothetical protein
VYQTQLKTYLEPQFANSDTIALLAFRVVPETEPNSSLRIIDVRGKAYLEAIYLDKNIWIELSSVESKGVNIALELSSHRSKIVSIPLDIKKRNIIVPISNSFKEKMVRSFLDIIDYMNKQPIRKSYRIYDGICYNFISHIKDLESEINIEPSSDYEIISYRYFINQVIQENLNIIKDMKINLFDESKYNLYK